MEVYVYCSLCPVHAFGVPYSGGGAVSRDVHYLKGEITPLEPGSGAIVCIELFLSHRKESPYSKKLVESDLALQTVCPHGQFRSHQIISFCKMRVIKTVFGVLFVQALSLIHI